METISSSSDDIPVKTKNLAKNQDKDHPDVNPGLLHIGTHTLEDLLDKQMNVYPTCMAIPHPRQSQLYNPQPHRRDQPTALLPGA